MKKRTLTGLLFVLVVAVSTMWAFSTVLHPSKSGFELVFLKDNTLLLSDSDVLSYNWTSQEIFLTDGASQRLIQQGESLYSFTDGFVIRLNGEEIYRGFSVRLLCQRHLRLQKSQSCFQMYFSHIASQTNMH